MKLSRTTLLLLGIVVSVILLGGGYMLYSRQARARDEVQTSIAAAQANLLKAINSRKALDNQLAQSEGELAKAYSLLKDANTKLSESITSFPHSIESIDYYELLFALAQKHNLELSSLTAGKPAGKTIAQITYFAVPFNISMSGTMPDIIDFLADITSGKEFRTAVIESVGLSGPPPLSAEARQGMTPEEAGAAEQAMVSLILTLYGYR